MEEKRLFREHRGCLSESMDTMVEVNTLEDIKNIINKGLRKSNLMYIQDIRIKEYQNKKDIRINWDKTYIVMGRYKSMKEFSPIGYANFYDEPNDVENGDWVIIADEYNTKSLIGRIMFTCDAKAKSVFYLDGVNQFWHNHHVSFTKLTKEQIDILGLEK